MEIEYALTADDVVAFQIYVFDHSPAIERQQRVMKRWVVLGSLVLPLLIWAIVIPLTVTADDIGGVILGSIVLCAVPIAWVYAYLTYPIARILRSKTRARVKRWCEERASSELGRRLTITPASIDWASTVATGSLLWSGVTNLVTEKNHLFLFTDAENAFVVPKRAFRDESDFEKFVETARQYWELARKQNTPEASGG